MKQVIIIEDDPGLLEPMAIILRNSGYAVTAFFGGELILANNFIPPDIFIIDKQLRGEDGLDICRHLKSREETRNIPVIMVSANPNIKTLAEAASADSALAKPFKMKELREVVAKHLAE